jgi:hypothetical protein
MQLCKQMVLVLQNGRTEVLLLLAAQILGGEIREKTSGLSRGKNGGPRHFEAQCEPKLHSTKTHKSKGPDTLKPR